MNDPTLPSPTPPPHYPLTPPLLFSHYPAIPPPVRLRLADTGDHACPYLPGRTSTNRAFRAGEIPPLVYQAFMDAAFRRSGTIVYQPACRGCRACVPLRVPVAAFAPSTSQRRAWRRNQDLTVTVGPPEPDAERFALYRTYVTEWHGKPAGGDAGDDGTETEAESYGAFASFLYESPVETLEWRYRDPAGRLVGVGICDVSDVAVSSVYFYHDPAERRRSLGTFAALYEIAECRRLGVPYYYLGYWVDGCGAMAYKAAYRPHELLNTDGVWRPPGPAAPAADAGGGAGRPPDTGPSDRGVARSDGP